MNNIPDDPPDVPAILVYVRPPDARVPKAAWFGQTVKATARLAAERQHFTAVELTPAQVELAKAAVPEGEITSAGRLSLPGVKPDVLERLLGNLAGEPALAADGSGPLPPGVVPTFVGASDEIPPQNVPVDPLWAALAVNMVVLAPEQDSQGVPQGWWEAVIVAIHGDVFTLRFRDYPRQALVRRKRDELAIMYPPPVRV